MTTERHSDRKGAHGVRGLWRDLGRAFDRFRHVPPAGIVPLYWRALTIGRQKLAVQTPPRRAERVVVSLSTIPSRAKRLGGVLNSLLDQTEPADRIVLALPDFSGRENTAYPPVDTLGLPEGIAVLRTADHGPATKFLPALEAEPDAVIVVVDDDVILPRDFLATLLAAHRRLPGCALGYRGVQLVPGQAFVDLTHILATAVSAPTKVDVLFGTWGYLLPVGVLDHIGREHGETDDHMRWVDDVWLSGMLARRKVPRLVVPARAFPIETGNALRLALSGGPNRSGDNDHRAIAAFRDDW